MFPKQLLKDYLTDRQEEKLATLAPGDSAIVDIGGEGVAAWRAPEFGAAHRGWINLKEAVLGRDDEAIVNEVERGEDYLKEKFETALNSEELTGDARAAVFRLVADSSIERRSASGSTAPLTRCSTVMAVKILGCSAPDSPATSISTSGSLTDSTAISTRSGVTSNRSTVPAIMSAVVVSIGVMMVSSKPLMAFVSRHPTVVILCLGFLMMIGFSLTAEGLGFHIPKGYLYAAIGFSILIEFFNQFARARRKRSLQGERGLRDRTAHAVMRLLGGKVQADEVGDEIADMLEGSTDDSMLFDRRERVMISGVLGLAGQSIRKAMTDRMDVDRVNLDDPLERIHQTLLESPYSRLLVTRGANIDEPLGYVHKKELFRELIKGGQPDIESMVRTPINLPDSSSVLNALEQMRQASTHVAFVVNEFGNFEGLLTLTDILEAIAGELPDASEMEGPDIEEVDGGHRVSGAVNLAVLRERLGFDARATDDYQTLAGLVMSELDRLPLIGDQLEYAGWTLSVVEVRDRRATRMLMRRT